MSIFEHARFEIWNQVQHPYKHNLTDFAYTNSALPGVSNVQSTMDWIVNVLYPIPKAAVANPAALPSVGNTIGDYRVVTNDGDGKSAGYRWEQREGDAVAKWYKIYDMDFGAGSVLQQAMDNAQELFVQKFGNDDLDSSGVAVAGTYAGQVIYGGKTASKNLTLRANAGDGVGANTGFVQVDDRFRLLQDGTSSAPQFSNSTGKTGVYFSGETLRVSANQTFVFYADSTSIQTQVNSHLFGSGSTSEVAFANQIANTGFMSFSGNSSSSSGGSVLVYGSSHATKPNIVEFKTAGTARIQVDASGNLLPVADQSYNLGSSSLSFASLFANLLDSNSGTLTFQTNQTTAGSIDSSQKWTIGAASSTQTHIFKGAQLQLQAAASSTQFTIRRDGTDGSISLTGNTSAATGGEIIVYGHTHATKADIIEFANNSTLNGSVSSAGLWTVGASGGTQVHALNGFLATTKSIGIGGTTNASAIIEIGTSNPLTGANQWGARANHAATSACTATQAGFLTNLTNAAGSYTIANRLGFWHSNNAKGASSTITNDIAFYSENPSQGSFNAVLSNSLSGSGSFFIYQTSGGNPSQFGGAICTSSASISSTATIAALSSTTSFVYISGSTGTTIQGITAGIDGQLIRIWSRQANLTIANQNGSASAANRIYTNTGADVSITAPGSATLVYSTTDSSWVLMSSLA